MRGLAILALLTPACVDGHDHDHHHQPPRPPDHPVAYHLSVLGDPGDLVVQVDGTTGLVHDTSFASADLPVVEVVVELSDPTGLPIDELILTPGVVARDCRPGDVPTRISEDVCVFAHGEVRYASTTVEFAAGGCVADGFCIAACSPPDGGRCAAGQRCTSTVASFEPLRSRVECVEPGWRTAGQACAWTARADGRFVDDCAAGLFCHDDRCKPLCTSDACAPSQVCAPVPGHAPEITVCQNQDLR